MQGNGDLAGQPPSVRLTGAEWLLLLVLATVQFTHIMDFIIIMPLEPQFEQTLGLSTNQFGLIVSVYGYSAGLAGLAAALFLDRFDRKRSLLVLYAGFTAGTLLCAVAPSYGWLLVGRTVAGAFGGVAAANVLAMVGDAFADVRRGTAMGVVMSAFSVASVAGVPAGLYLAEWSDAKWRAPFAGLGLVALGVFPLAAVVLPPFRGHLARGQVQQSDVKAVLANLWAVLVHPSHLRAYTLSTVLVFSSFTIGPFLAAYLVKNVGRPTDQLPYIYLFGGAATLLTTTPIGRISDRFGKLRVFRYLALLTIVSVLLGTNLQPGTSLLVTLAVTTLMWVAMSGRMVPAMAMITGSASYRHRGSFLSVNSCVQQLAMGLATWTATSLLNDAGPGQPMEGFATVGLVAGAAGLVSIVLAGCLRPSAEGQQAVDRVGPLLPLRSASTAVTRPSDSLTSRRPSADGDFAELSEPAT